MAVELYVTKKGESTCVAVLGEFELEGVDELLARLERLKDEQDPPTLDLSRILVVDQAFAEHSLIRGA
jgi:hypothetical protein